MQALLSAGYALPALGGMSAVEWLLLGGALALGIAACVFVGRLRKRGITVPGRMCAGCPNLPPRDKPKEEP